MSLLASASLLLGLAIFLFSGIKLIWRGVSAFHLSILGFSVFSFIDAGKYYFIERQTRGDFGDTIFLKVWIVSAIGFILFLSVYRFAFSRKRRPVSIGLRDSRAIAYSVRFPAILIISMFLIAINAVIPKSGGYSALVNVVTTGFLISASGYYISKRKISLFVVFLILAVLTIYIGEYTSRRVFISMAVPIVGFILLSLNFLQRRSQNSVRVFVAIAAVAFFVFLNALRAGHDFGEGYDENDPVGNTINYILTLRSIDTYWNTNYVFHHFEEDYELYFGETYASIPVALVPRAVWPDKPVGFAAPLGMMQFYGYQTEFSPELWNQTNQYSLSPGLFGEAYANFGISGAILLPVLLAFLAKYVDIKTQRGSFQERLQYIFVLSSFFLIHRGDAYSALLYPLFLFFGAYMFKLFIERRKQSMKKLHASRGSFPRRFPSRTAR